MASEIWKKNITVWGEHCVYWSLTLFALEDLWLYCSRISWSESFSKSILPGTAIVAFVICFIWQILWWRHKMETFYALLALCTGNSQVTGELPSQRPVTRSFDVFFNLRLNKQSGRRWFETPSHSLWRHCNLKRCDIIIYHRILKRGIVRHTHFQIYFARYVERKI